jgi:hypothetical protein
MPTSSLRIFGLRSGCGGYNANSDEYNGSNDDPKVGDPDKMGADSQTDDEDDESNQVGAER